ncbi:MAG: hypothetical protein QGI05_01665 [Candidatus Omnitrophota bacterium]|nr:hypothetical protein [Candidatus Omnitrophota bacterium]
MKAILKTIKKFFKPEYKKAFLVTIKCHDCEEEVSVRINRSADFQLDYNPKNPKHFYTIKKEIIGKNCYNLMQLEIALTKNTKVLYTNTKSCDFVKFDKE